MSVIRTFQTEGETSKKGEAAWGEGRRSKIVAFIGENLSEGD